MQPSTDPQLENARSGLARFSALFFAPGFSRWVLGLFFHFSALQRGFSPRLQPYAWDIFYLRINRPCLLRLLAVVWLAAASFTAGAADHVLLIAGQGGEEKYTREFTDSLVTLRDLLVNRHGYPAGNARLLTGEKTPAPSANGPTTLEAIKAELGQLAKAGQTSDTLLLIMIGHGQSDYVEPRFNLAGPDLTGQALAELMKPIKIQDQRLILIFPCSGHFAELLARPRRAILTSGDGARQIYHSVMTPYLIAALTEPRADANRDGSLTFYELFDFIAREVDGYYTMKNLLQTENTRAGR